LTQLLIVEDDLLVLDPLSRYLQQKGYEVQTATTLEKAFSFCRNGSPQVILTDLHLPDGVALDFLKKAQATPQKAIFILMTEMGDENLLLEALRLGANDYLFKPITNYENVASVIDKQIKKHPQKGKVLTDLELDQSEGIHHMIEKGDFKMIFQPIFNLEDRSIFGYEALLRPGKTSPISKPGALMDLAKTLGVSQELDVACIEKALNTTPQNTPRLFANIETDTVADPDSLLKVVTLADRFKQPLVLEVTERGTVANFNQLIGPCEILRKRKIDLAVDDVGSGYASIERVLSIRPQFLKIAMSITRSVDVDQIRQVMAESILYMSERIGALVIAEGIETERELTILQQVGVKFGQGFYLSPKA